MLRNKKGLSAIVMTIIMIGLVLVAVGIVWAVVSGIIERQVEEVDYNQDCVGINFQIRNLECAGADCNITIQRRAGSTGSPIDGIAVTFSSESESSNEENIEGNVAATLTKSLPHNLPSTVPTRADMRIYFEKPDGTNHYCSNVFSTD